MIGNAAYPTFQIFLSIIVAMVITMAMLPLWIRFLKHREIGQQVRADGPQGHLVKQGTPTMGGVIMLVAILITMVLIGKPDPATVLAVGATMLTGFLGLVDDMSKVVKERSLGLTPKAKLLGQAVISVFFCLFAVNWADISPIVSFPFTDATLDLGILSTQINVFRHAVAIPWLYILFIFLLMAGLSNAVNLTDGLDGLAGGTVLITMVIMAAIGFTHGNVDLAILAGACAGSCIGFLWFNCYPADIFMGDTGSLALGTAFAAIAVLTKTEVFSLIIGGLFVFEALSVLIQVVHFKLTGRRIFLMAPIHHHFEKKGWSETKVVIRFWIISGILAGVGFALYFIQVV